MSEDELSLEELAAAAGMTPRNVRAYQTKGLIPPPVRRGRRSVYRTEHLTRLRAVERARERGASLSLIAAHLRDGRPLEGDTLVEWGTGRRGVHLLEQLLHRSHPMVDVLAAAGLVSREGPTAPDGTRLFDIVGFLHDLGVDVEATLRVAQHAVRAAEPVAVAARDALVGHEPDRTAAAALGELAGLVVRQVVRASAG